MHFINLNCVFREKYETTIIFANYNCQTLTLTLIINWPLLSIRERPHSFPLGKKGVISHDCLQIFQKFSQRYEIRYAFFRYDDRNVMISQRYEILSKNLQQNY